MKGNIDLREYVEVINTAGSAEELEAWLGARGIGGTKYEIMVHLECAWELAHEKEIRRLYDAEFDGEYSPSVVEMNGVKYVIFGYSHGREGYSAGREVVARIRQEIEQLGDGEDFLVEECLDEYLGIKKLAKGKSFMDHLDGITHRGRVIGWLSIFFPGAGKLIDSSVTKENEKGDYCKAAFAYTQTQDRKDRRKHWEKLRVFHRGVLEDIPDLNKSEKATLCDLRCFRDVTGAAALFDLKSLEKFKAIERARDMPLPIRILAHKWVLEGVDSYKPLGVYDALKAIQVPFSRLRTPEERSQYMVDFAINRARERGLKTVKSFVGYGHEEEMVYFFRHPEFRPFNRT